MKTSLILLSVVIIFFSCNNKADESRVPAKVEDVKPEERSSFIPVTSYIKGQLLSITQQGINPSIKITKANKTDSSSLNLADLRTVLAEFLTPVIDTINLTSLFKEEKFNDQTLNAFTFTYDPKTTLPDTMQLKHWDVYIDPDANKISKVYMVKQRQDTTFQLTWVNDAWCSIRTIINKNGKESFVEKEEKITWSSRSK